MASNATCGPSPPSSNDETLRSSAFGTNPSQREPYAEHGAVARRRRLLRPATAERPARRGRHADLVYLCGSAFEGFTPDPGSLAELHGDPRRCRPRRSCTTRSRSAGPASSRRRTERRSFYAARRMLLERADRFLAISTSSAREATEDFGLDPSTSPSSAAGSTIASRPADDPERTLDELRRRCPRPSARRTSLYVGGFQPQKNVEGLLTAYAGLDPDAPRGAPTRDRRERSGGAPAVSGNAGGASSGIADRVVFTGLVDDETLAAALPVRPAAGVPEPPRGIRAAGRRGDRVRHTGDLVEHVVAARGDRLGAVHLRPRPTPMRSPPRSPGC